jgi:hypothetical protein
MMISFSQNEIACWRSPFIGVLCPPSYTAPHARGKRNVVNVLRSANVRVVKGWPHPALPGRAAWVPTTIGMAPRSSAKAARCACAHIQTHECINSGNGDWQRAKSQIAQGNRLQIRSGNRMAGAWAWPWGSHTSTQAHAWVCTMAGQGIAYRAAHTGQRHGNGDVGQGRAACAHGQGLQGALWRIHELRFL